MSSYGHDVKRQDECSGYCKQFTPDGKCVEFAAGVSPVCIEYLSAAGVFSETAQDTHTTQSAASVNYERPTINQQRRALQLITDFSKSICNEIPLTSSKNGVELSGEGKADLNRLLGWVFDVGISGTAKYDNEETKGVLQKDLAHALETGANCKYNVFVQLKDRLLSDAEHR